MKKSEQVVEKIFEAFQSGWKNLAYTVHKSGMAVGG
jgi:hypothetical protein